MPAASMIALGTTVLIIFLSMHSFADLLGLINTGGSRQKHTPTLNQALLERVFSWIGGYTQNLGDSRYQQGSLDNNPSTRTEIPARSKLQPNSTDASPENFYL
jgi:hypothetical protein